MKKGPSLVAGLIFLLIAIAQAARVYYGVTVTMTSAAGAFVVPVWVSVIAVLVALFMAYWLFSGCCCCRKCKCCHKDASACGCDKKNPIV